MIGQFIIARQLYRSRATHTPLLHLDRRQIRIAAPHHPPQSPHRRRAQLQTTRSFFSIPEPSNLPLAGTTASTSDGIPWLFLLEIGIGFPIALWSYKCLMMILFQRSIIYLPFLPLGGRSESLSSPTPELLKELGGLDWKQLNCVSRARSTRLRTKVELKGIDIGMKPSIVMKKGSILKESREISSEKIEPEIVIFYMQGNAGTPLHRLPLFRSLLSSLPSSNSTTTRIIAFAPRSYWSSTRSTPTESTLLLDYLSALQRTIELYPNSKIILYGHSLGASASLLLLLRRRGEPLDLLLSSEMKERIKGLIVENPMPSIPYMVRTLYKEKWLPYHYLGPLAFDKWDALNLILERSSATKVKKPGEGQLGIKSLWIRSGKDELIPTTNEGLEEGDMVRKMYDAFPEEEGKRWVDVKDALHDTAWLDRTWREQVTRFIDEIRKYV